MIPSPHSAHLAQSLVRRWSCLTLSTLVLSLIIGSYFKVNAQTTPRVFVTPTLSDGQKNSLQLSKKVTSELLKHLKRDKKIEIEDGKTKQRGSGEAKLMEFEAQKVNAIDLYNEGKYEQALAAFISSLRGFQNHITAIRDMKSLFQILYYAAATCMELEYGADAKDYLQQLAAIAPEGEFEVKVSEKTKNKYAKERKKLLKKKRGAINIETIPLGAKVWVNGKEHCVSPCEINDLPRGKHYLWASKEGVGKAGRLVQVKGGKSAGIKLNLAPEKQVKPQDPVTPEMAILMEGQLNLGRVDGVLQEQLDLVAEEQHVDFIVTTYLVALKQKMTLFTFLYHVNNKQFVAVEPNQFGINFSATRMASIGAGRKLSKLIERFPDESISGVYQPILDALKLAQQERDQKVTVVNPPKSNSSMTQNPITETPIAKTPINPNFKPSTPADLKVPPKTDTTSALLPPPTHQQTSGEKTEKGITSSPWFWTGVGAVVVTGAAISTYLILDSSSDQNLQRFQSRVVW